MKEEKVRPLLEGPWAIFKLFGFTSYFEVRKFGTWAISRSIYGLCVSLELATYFRFYYRRGYTCTLECLILFITCLLADIMIWRAYWSMTYEDPGFVNDAKTIVEASALPQKEFEEVIEKTIERITGLPPGSQNWPMVTIKRYGECKMIKTNHVHHCSMCEKCVFLMDHHCCFSDKCVGYYSMKPFTIFTANVCMLTVVGMSTIWYNLTVRNFEAQEGLLGFIDFWRSIYSRSPSLGYSFWTIYDIFLIVSSMSNGIFAAKMLYGFYESVRENENEIDVYQKKILRKNGKGDQIRDRPKRTCKQILSHIFGE